VVRHHAHVVGLQVDLQPLDEPARHLEALGDRLDVLEDDAAVHPREARHLGERVGLTVGEARD
jgi:hypothetical protein